MVNRPSTQDMVSWTTMISRYSQQCCSKQILEVFQQMQKEGVEPDEVMFMNILNACVGSAVLKEGKKICALVVRAGFESDTSLGNALVEGHGGYRFDKGDSSEHD